MNLQQAINDLNLPALEYRAYKCLCTRLGWDCLSEKEYIEQKDQLPEIKKVYPTRQTFLLDEQRIQKVVFAGCYDYYFIVFKDNELFQIETPNIRVSKKTGCGCQIFQEDVDNYEGIPAKRVLSSYTGEHVGDVYKYASKKLVVESYKDGSKDEIRLIESIGELPQELFDKLPSDFIDLITEEKIALKGYSISTSPYILYRFLKY